MLNWEGCGRKQPWLISRYHTSTFLEVLKKAMKPLGRIASLQVKVDRYRIISWYIQYSSFNM
jgi:hypothetical protein